MTGTTSPSPWLCAAVGLLLLTVGLAGCMTDDDSGASGPETSGCPSRGSGSPTEITQQYLSQDTTWSPDSSKRADIVLKGTHSLALNNHTLTIQPCTIVEVESHGITATRDASTLEILGTEGKDVLVRGAQQTPGSWTGIELHMASTDGHVLRNATIEHGGAPGAIGAPAGGLVVEELGARDSLTIDNVTVQTSLNAGLHLEPASGFDQTVGPAPGFDQTTGLPNLVFQNNTFTNNTRPGVETEPILAQVLDSASSYEGNDGPGVHIRPTTTHMEGRHVWNDLDVPYTIDGTRGQYKGSILLGGQLKVEAGTTVEFERGAGGFTVLGGEGHGHKPGLVSLGEENDRITFTGAIKKAGTWESIRFVGEGTENHISNTDIAFGGGASYATGGHAAGANVFLDAPTSNAPFSGYTVKVFNSKFTLSGGDGLMVDAPSQIDLQMDHVTFGLNNGHPISVHPSNIEDLETTFVTGAGSLAGAGELTFLANSKPTVMIAQTDLPAGDVTIPALDNPYEAKFGLTKDTAGTLTLPAGTEIQFRHDRGFTVEREQPTGGYATLTAQGTASDPVVLEGTTAQPGHWRGLHVQTGSQANVLEHTKIRHGGSSDWQSETCAGQPQLDSAHAPGGNLIVGDDCANKPNGKVTWLSGSSTQHPSGMAGIWVNDCDEISLVTSGSPQVSYTSFDTTDLRAHSSSCPPATN